MAPRVWPTLLSATPASNGGGVASADLLPLELARLHWDTAVGETVEFRAAVPGDLLDGAGFAVVDAGPPAVVCRLRTLPDTVGPGLRALVCGLNPSLVAADAGFGYAGPSNRFWPVALAAGLVTRARDPLHALVVDHVGMTDLVKRATPSAAALAADEYRAGAARVRRLVGRLQPRLVLFVGLAGWRAAADPRARPGWQPGGWGGAPAYVMPSTSGLNARTPRAALENHVRAAVA